MCIGVHGCAWMCMDVHGCAWMGMLCDQDVRGHACIFSWGPQRTQTKAQSKDRRWASEPVKLICLLGSTNLGDNASPSKMDFGEALLKVQPPVI